MIYNIIALSKFHESNLRTLINTTYISKKHNINKISQKYKLIHKFRTQLTNSHMSYLSIPNIQSHTTSYLTILS